MNTIILSAGKFNPKNMSVGMISDQGLLPIRGKPSINWCIDSILDKGFDNIKIILRENNTRLSKFIGYNYPNVQQVFINDNENLFNSLGSILEVCDENLPTQLILGDTMINEDFPSEPDVFLASSNIKASKQWCLVSKDSNGHIDRIYNKERDLSLVGKEALVGYYKFSNTKFLKKVVKQAGNSNENDFLKAFLAYNQQIPIVVKTTNKWLDFGHVSGAVQARLELFNAREFNNLKVDAVRGTITKTSKKKQKLLDEVNWYKSLPPEVSCYSPRVFNVVETEQTVSYEMELYGYANLAETFIYGSNNLEDWYNIVESLLKVHKVFESYCEAKDRAELIEIYKTKTKQRIEEIKKANPEIFAMMKSEYLVVNGVYYKNYSLLKEKLEDGIGALLNYDKRTIVHGDYCFSNILFDPTHYLFKFIDPRGRFKERGIFGDPRYDIAKLRHSIVGMYDFIVAELFRLEEIKPDAYEFQISAPVLTDKLETYFDELVMEYGYNRKEIKLIEGLLFLTMIPLHPDNVKRQKAFYLTAIKKLNEVLYDE